MRPPRHPGRVLHVLDQSLPHVSGYAVRSHYILRVENELGIEASAVTSLRHEGAPGKERVEGVTYFRSNGSGRVRGIGPLREFSAMRVLQAAVVQAARETSAELIHAHSPLVVGWPAAWAARSLGLPLVYEVRALWEDAAVDQGKTRPGSLRYRLTRALETRLLRRAEAVVTICDGLREEISARLGATGHVHVVQNGVDSAKFRPVAPQSFAVGPIGEGDPVLGYIGSLFRFEGVQVAVEAMRKIVQEVPRARLLVVGGGEMSAELAARVRELGLEGHVHMAGRVPHGEVERFYARSDVLIYPRISKRITEMVTPLKPLEAMAMGKPVLVSDVGGLKEIAPRGTAEWFRAGDPGDLAERAVGLLQDLARSRALGEAARGHVERERDWRKMAAGYLAVYEGALTRGA